MLIMPRLPFTPRRPLGRGAPRNVALLPLLALLLLSLSSEFLRVMFSSPGLLPLVHASLLASGKLESCENTGKLFCQNKITALLSIEQKQLLDAESIEVNVEGGDRQLARPIKISWRKTASYWKYPLRYLEQVPNRMVLSGGTG